MKDQDKIEKLLDSMVREQIRLNQIKTFFDKTRSGFTKDECREVQIQMLESMSALATFQAEYDKVIELLR